MPARKLLIFLEYYIAMFYENLRMAKVDVYRNIIRWMLFIVAGISYSTTNAQYSLQIAPVDKDSVFLSDSLSLQTNFKTRAQCADYVRKLLPALNAKGYSLCSIDTVRYDTASATMSLYVGSRFSGALLNVDSVDKNILDAVNWNKKKFESKVDFQGMHELQVKILDRLENSGYPFAEVRFDGVDITDGQVRAKLLVNKGPLYKIDSVRNLGNAKISNLFLARYLGIPNGSLFRKERLLNISKRINELPYVQEEQPYSLTLLATGSVLNLYLKPKRSSQINILVGFLPAVQSANNIYEAPRTKLLFTGEATINLRNSLGNGETIGLNWQQIQQKSPRLNILFQQPFLFGSPFGVNFAFDLFKKDSSFLNINLLLGMQYAASSNRSGAVFIQHFRSNLITVDTFSVKANHRLPLEADVNSVSLGSSFEFVNTDYRFNPRRGNELQVTASAGTKNIKKNDVIIELQDVSDPSFNFNSLYDTVKLSSYQFRIRAAAAHYFPLSRASTLKGAVSGGWYQSPSIFRNELFQIGGYRLLRGFDEESIYASQFGVATAEFRYLVGQNSFFFSFIDWGWARNAAASRVTSNTFFGVGAGIAFETRAGIFNISYAAGKRDDASFNLRQSKIHLGYVSYF